MRDEAIGGGRIRLGILQAGENSESMPASTPNYESLFRGMFQRASADASASAGAGAGADAHFELCFIQVRFGDFPSSVDAYDAYLVTGSASGVYDEHDWIAPLEAFIRAAFAAHKPLVGICFGHQVIAHALGGRAEKFSGGWGCGVRTLPVLERGSVFGEDKQDVTLLYVHQDQVVEAPPGASVLLGDDFCGIASFAIRDRVLCFQGHPEFTAQVVGDIADLRAADIGEGRVSACHASLETPHEGDAIGGVIADFIKRAVESRGLSNRVSA